MMEISPEMLINCKDCNSRMFTMCCTVLVRVDVCQHNNMSTQASSPGLRIDNTGAGRFSVFDGLLSYYKA